MKKIFVPIAAILFLFACNSQGNQNSQTENASVVEKVVTAVSSAFNSITPPPKAVPPAPETIAVSNSKGTVAKTSRGTVVIVPENAFVYEDGTAVKGQVSLHLVEILTASEIILSGIPMNVEHDGKVEPFISDGMFKITASADDKPVKIAEGKSITVCNESQKNNSDFDYWYFDEKKGKWENLGDRGQTSSARQVETIAAKENPEMAKRYQAYQSTESDLARRRIEVSADRNISKSSGSGKTGTKNSENEQINLDGDDFVFSLNATNEIHPELEAYKNVIWKTVKPLSTSEETQFVNDLGKAGLNIYLECSDKSKLVYNLSYGDKSILIQPVLTDKVGKSKTQFADMQKKYEEAIEEQKNTIKNYQKQSEFMNKAYNVFQVMNLGIYNCDRFYSSNKKPGFFSLNCKGVTVKNYVYAILNRREGVVSLNQAYLVNNRFRIPSEDVKGFVYVHSSGQIYKAIHTPGKEDNYDIRLEDAKISMDENGGLEKVINSL